MSHRGTPTQRSERPWKGGQQNTEFVTGGRTSPVPSYEYLLVIDFEATGNVRDSTTWEIVEFPIVLVRLNHPQPSHDATAHVGVDTGAGTSARRGHSGTSQVMYSLPSSKKDPDVFHTYVRPTRHDALSPQCTKATGITQSMVDPAPPLEEVLGNVGQWLIDRTGLSDESELDRKCLVVTCGDYDVKTALMSEMRNKSGIELLRVLRKWCNIKTVFQTWMDANPSGARDYGTKPRSLTMKSMLGYLNITLEGRHHSGIDDAWNIAKIVCRLANEEGARVSVTGDLRD
eukprot:GFYU01001164.1.p1 GENE.GFYU01001164.1~~GFYU01001164.1.p1  ORF type:complete len:287 (-),score=49.77 GFYU01001164.1:120-980(-)